MEDHLTFLYIKSSVLNLNPHLRIQTLESFMAIYMDTYIYVFYELWPINRAANLPSLVAQPSFYVNL